MTDCVVGEAETGIYTGLIMMIGSFLIPAHQSSLLQYNKETQMHK